ncbi:MAG: MoxR family ATPase [Gemmatimonadales bacterium]|nr:MoxR family ATPase [Gemmatimonadales bacterium]
MTVVDPVQGMTEADAEALARQLGALREGIARVIVGQRAAVDELLVAFLAGGHALLEGVPGLAKTLMIRTLAELVHLSFRRIQFTPDLMPTDIVGTEVLEEDPQTGRRQFRFQRGPIFAQIVLADEINRTPPKTQAALLEAMQEREVTYGGTTYTLEKPFFVLATQNPIEQAGTYPLPEAQLDRFLLNVRIGYPSEAEEVEVLRRTTGRLAGAAEPVITGAQILQLQRAVRGVPVSDDLLAWAARLVRATRPADSPVNAVRQYVRWGAGPRAGQALVLGAKARALLEGRFAVTLADLEAVALPVLRHRVLVNFRAEGEGIDADAVTRTLLGAVPRPRSPLA